MEYRSEPRYEIDQPLMVTDLRVGLGPFLGRLVNLSARGVQVILNWELAVSSEVKIEWDGTLLLGAVVYCKPQGGEYSIGVALEHAVYDTHLLTEILSEGPDYDEAISAG